MEKKAAIRGRSTDHRMRISASTGWHHYIIYGNFRTHFSASFCGDSSNPPPQVKDGDCYCISNQIQFRLSSRSFTYFISVASYSRKLTTNLSESLPVIGFTFASVEKKTHRIQIVPVANIELKFRPLFHFLHQLPDTLDSLSVFEVQRTAPVMTFLFS